MEINQAFSKRLLYFGADSRNWGNVVSSYCPWGSPGKNTKAEAPILWPPDVKNQLIGKDPDAGKD